MNKWHKHFLLMAKLCSEMSKDPSTQSGAVLVRPDKSVAATGYNGFARSMQDSPELYDNRDEKYDRIIHSEMNALIHARDSSCDGYTLYTWPFLSCSRCCVHMIQAGIKTFVAPMANQEQLKRWGPSFDRTRGYIRDSGAQFLEYSMEEILGE